MAQNTSQPGTRIRTVIGNGLLGISIVMILYHISSVIYPYFNSLLHQNIHLGFAMTVLCLGYMVKAGSRTRFLAYLGLLVLGLVCLVFMHVESERLHMWAGFPEPQDLVIGVLLVILVFYYTFRTFGIIFPTLALLSVLYAAFGHLLGGQLAHPYYKPELVISNLSVGFEGIYGMVLATSADLIFLFVIFGSMFESVGINNFFMEVGKFLGARVRGGSAFTAIISSTFVGMCTGAAAANVALTGSFTIPLMKRTGYTPPQAAAVEAVASTGGQLTPPVMGVAVFLMASLLGMTYSSLMVAALLPAASYYVACSASVLLIAGYYRIPKLQAAVDRTVLLAGAPVFIIPMTTVTVLLLLHYTPAYAALGGIILLLATAFVRGATRPRWAQFSRGLVQGATLAASLAVACGTIGMFTKMLTFTGAGPKISTVIKSIAGGNLLLALICTMLLCILMGCAMPTVVAYLVVAMVVAPSLVDMGVPLLSAHLFVFYFAILSTVTPPVAGASMVGSRLAETSYMKASWESFKMVLPFLVVPYFVIYNPIIILQPQEPIAAAEAFITLGIGMLATARAAQGFAKTKLSAPERCVYAALALLACWQGLSTGMVSNTARLIGFVALIAVWSGMWLLERVKIRKLSFSGAA